MIFLKNFQRTQLNFLGFRWLSFVIAGVMLLLTVWSLMFQGFNYGIDFRGGVLLEVRTSEPINLAVLRKKLSSVVPGEILCQTFHNPTEVLIHIERSDNSSKMIKDVKERLGPKVEYRRIETVGPKVGSELIFQGITAISLAFLAMLAYVNFRFGFSFSACAFLALIHDCLGIICLFTVFQVEFTETAIVAILLTASYSINNIVVVFDRIRENSQKKISQRMDDVVSKSLNETFYRTLMTSGTTLLVLCTLYLFGGEIIASFSLPIIVGIIIGTYSSLFFAAPLLIYFKPLAYS